MSLIHQCSVLSVTRDWFIFCLLRDSLNYTDYQKCPTVACRIKIKMRTKGIVSFMHQWKAYIQNYIYCRWNRNKNTTKAIKYYQCAYSICSSETINGLHLLSLLTLLSFFKLWTKLGSEISPNTEFCKTSIL